jgi:LPS sulfotransferase NodH
VNCDSGDVQGSSASQRLCRHAPCIARAGPAYKVAGEWFALDDNGRHEVRMALSIRRTRYVRQLEEVFGQALACDPAALKPVPPVVVILCFTNRSGSNYLAALLASSGKVRNRGEALLPEVLRNWRDELAVASLSAVFNEIIDPSNRGRRIKPTCFKAGANQLAALDDLGYLDGLGARVRYLHIRREDRLGQAISFEIAAQTLAWTSLQDPTTDRVHYDRAAIEARLSGIVRADEGFDEIFARRGVTPCRVVYERLMADTVGEVARIGRELGIGDLAPRFDRVSLERQDDPRKAEFRARFLAGN